MHIDQYVADAAKHCGPSVTNSCGLQDKTHGKTIRQTYYVGPRQATLADIGQLHNDCQMNLSPKEQTVGRSTLARWASSTQLLVEKGNGLSLPKSSGTVAYEREETKVHVSLLELVELCSVFC